VTWSYREFVDKKLLFKIDIFLPCIFLNFVVFLRDEHMFIMLRTNRLLREIFGPQG
jgi:hypothetical protein